MSRSIYWKFSLPLILLVAVCMSILGFYMVNSVRNSQLDHLRSTLTNEARLISDDAQPDFANAGNLNNLDALAKSVGNEIDSRVTIIALDGTVLGDTWEDPSTLENHSTRPEVQAALASGFGESTRFSTTTNQNMLYIAVPIRLQDKVVGVSRVSLALTSVQDSINNVIITIAWAVAIAALLVILATIFITRMLTRRIRQVTKAAENISRGQFDHQIVVNSGDEIGRLGNSFNRMSFNIKEMMDAISDEKSKLVSVLETITDGVIMTDTKGNILLANPAAENLFTFKSSQTLGKPLIEVWPRCSPTSAKNNARPPGNLTAACR
jgi:two-component system, OmpR family, phosphate regulon sensor histidine kinase PhoR